MSREATYTIKGFLYQFNVTLLKILNSSNEKLITAEGVVEDIDIVAGKNIEAIQCKYHETKTDFKLSDIYEPVLQMMVHFLNNSEYNITYVLYAHFPNENFGERKLTLEELERIKNSENKDFSKFTSLLTSLDINAFRSKFKFVIGDSYDLTVTKVQEELIASGIWPAPISCTSCYESISHIFSLS